jgi:hypothetical protein
MEKSKRFEYRDDHVQSANTLFHFMKQRESELKSALDTKEPYLEAKTLFEYIKEAHELLAEHKKKYSRLLIANGNPKLMAFLQTSARL